MAIKYFDHTSGIAGTSGTAVSMATARQCTTGYTTSAGDDMRALATLPVDTGFSGVFEHRYDGVQVNDNTFWKPIISCPMKRRRATWTRSGTTLTITSVGHGLSTGDYIFIGPNGISDILALPYAVATFMQSITVSGDTFTITCTNAGATSGWVEYTCKLCEPDKYFTWSRSGTTITCTTYIPHGEGAGTKNIHIKQNSATTAILQTTIKSATFSSTNTITFTDTAAGATSGAGFWEHGWMPATNVSITVDSVGGMNYEGPRQYPVTATAFTTGKVASIQMLSGSMDLSAYQVFSAQFGITLTCTHRVVLCSDPSGNTPITGCNWYITPSGAATLNGLTRYKAITMVPYGSSTQWSANEVVTSGDLRHNPTHCNGAAGIYRCTTNGTSASFEPIWKTDGSTIADGSTTWVFNGYENLPNNVGSIAIYIDNDIAAVTTTLDCIAAFKAPSGVTSFGYEYLVTPEPTAYIARDTVYSQGDITHPTPTFGSNMRYQCVTAGTSHATTEPDWNYRIGSLTTDGTSVWKNIGFEDSVYLVRTFSYLNDDSTLITFHDGGLAAGFQSTAIAKSLVNGYFNPLFPPLLTATAQVGNSSITVEDSCGFEVGHTIRISDTDDYVITSNDITTGVIGVSPNIVTERAIGQPVRFKKKTTKLYKIRPHYNIRHHSLALNTSVDGSTTNNAGTLANPVNYTGGYDSTYSEIVGRTYIYGFNNIGLYGHLSVTVRGWINIYNMGYIGFTSGFNEADITTTGSANRYSIIKNCVIGTCCTIGFQATLAQPLILFLQYFTVGPIAGNTTNNNAFLYGSSTVRCKAMFLHGHRTAASSYATIQCTPLVTAVFSRAGESLFDEVYVGNTSSTIGCTAINFETQPTILRNFKSDFCFSGGVSGNGKLLSRNYKDRSTTNGFYFPVVTAGGSTYQPWFLSENHQGVEGAIRWEQYGANVINDSSISGFHYRCYITSTMFHTVLPCVLPIPMRVRVTNGVPCSFSIKMRRDSTNIVCGIRIDKDINDLTDLISNPETLISVGADTNEDVTVTFTPNRTGIIEPKIIIYATDAVSSVYIGKLVKISG